MNKPAPPSDHNEPDTSLNQDRHVEVGRDVVESTIVTGDRNVIGNQNLVVHGNYIQAPLAPRSPAEQKLLNQVKAEVASRLHQSLHSAIFINLDKESQPQQVARIWDAEVKVGGRSLERLPHNTTILQVFDRPDIVGRLLILGNPGAGKTTTQLELAKALLERCDQNLNHPTPILLNLSSWRDERQLMHAWIISELKAKYGVRRDIAEQWLREMRLLPFLDGLDEVDPQRQKFCIHILNQFLAGEHAPLQVVICSRMEEYKRLGVKLRMNGAIYLRELTNLQIQAYLTSTHQQNLWKLLHQDASLLALLQAPLLLSMIVLAYQQGFLYQWQTLNTSQERLQFLLDTFIQGQLEQAPTTALSKNKKSYTRQQTRRWLTCLAQQLERESRIEFLIERLQPSCLPNRKLITGYHHQAKLISGLSHGLPVGLGFGLIGGLSGGLPVGLGFGLIGGLSGGLILGLSADLDSIAVTESLTWFWVKAAKGLIFGLILGLMFGLPVGLFGGLFGAGIGTRAQESVGLTARLIDGLSGGLILGLLGGLILGLSVGLIFALMSGLVGSEVEQKSFPNQGIWKTLQISLIYASIYGLIFGLFFGLSDGLIFGLFFGLSVGLIAGLLGGLFECLKHVALRMVLYYNGYAPWNYARFLNYCTDRLLLQRVGGRYRFMHKLLQEHFAAMPFEKP